MTRIKEVLNKEWINRACPACGAKDKIKYGFKRTWLVKDFEKHKGRDENIHFGRQKFKCKKCEYIFVSYKHNEREKHPDFRKIDFLCAYLSNNVGEQLENPNINSRPYFDSKLGKKIIPGNRLFYHTSFGGILHYDSKTYIPRATFYNWLKKISIKLKDIEFPPRRIKIIKNKLLVKNLVLSDINKKKFINSIPENDIRYLIEFSINL